MNRLNRVASLKDREVTKKLTEAALENHADRFFGRHVRRKRGGRRADRFRGLARQQFRGAPGLAENGGRQFRDGLTYRNACLRLAAMMRK